MNARPAEILEALIDRMNAAAPPDVSFRLEYYWIGADALAEVTFCRTTPGERPCRRHTLYFAAGRTEAEAAGELIVHYLNGFLYRGPVDPPVPERWPVPASSIEELALKLAVSGSA